MIDRGGLNLLFANLKELEDLYKAQKTKSKVQEKPVAPVEELTDTYTKIATENEPIENILKPIDTKSNFEYPADYTTGNLEEVPESEQIDENKFQQKVILDKDNVYRMVTVPLEPDVKTNVDILKEQIGVEQGLLDDTIADKVTTDPVPVEDFGGVNLGIQGAKQRELDDTIADKVLTDSQQKDEEADTVPTISQMYPRGTDLIKLYESKNKSGKPHLEAYEDPATGIMTIGFGNTKIDGRPVKKGDTITNEKAELAFNESSRESVFELKHLKSFLPKDIKFSKGFEDALISLLHNSSVEDVKYKKNKEGKRVETRAFKALKKGDLKSFSKELFDPKVGIVGAGRNKKNKPIVRGGLVERRQQELQFLDPSERYDIK